MIAISELSIIASVTRAELFLADLDLNDGVKFTLGQNVNVGSVTWRKETAQSPFVQGRVPVHEVKDASESTIVVYVLGATHAALNANLKELLDAFTEQYSYILRINVEGSDNQWECERADYEVAFATETLSARFVPVTLSFHRKPTPAVGVF